jgi:hypothetical protein
MLMLYGRKISWSSLLAVAAFIYFAVWTLSWLIYTDNIRGVHDWILFWDTSNLMASGSYDKIYPGVTPGFPFLYPPYFLFLIYPLAYLSKQHAYTLIVTFSSAMMILSFIVFNMIAPWSRSYLLKIFIIVLSSASWIIMLPLGHFSGLYLFLASAALLWRMRNKSWQAGVVLSLLMMKPNIGCLVPLLLLTRREWSMLWGWFAGFGSLVLLSLLFGNSIWADYLRITMTLDTIISQVPAWKQHTLYALWHSTLPQYLQQYVWHLWVISTTLLVGLCSYVWYVTKKEDKYYPRLFSLGLLTIIVSTPNLHYYDAILAAFPAVMWFTNSNGHYSKISSIIIGASIFSAYVIQQISVLYLQRGISLVGIPLTIWLIADAYDLLSQERVCQFNQGILPRRE